MLPGAVAFLFLINTGGWRAFNFISLVLLGNYSHLLVCPCHYIRLAFNVRFHLTLRVRERERERERWRKRSLGKELSLSTSNQAKVLILRRSSLPQIVLLEIAIIGIRPLGMMLLLSRHIELLYARPKEGDFKDTLPEDLLAPVLKALIDKTQINPSEVGDIVVGTVLAPGSQRAIECRMAAFYAGFPDTVPLRTVNRQCSSGLQAVADVAAAIRSGYYKIGIAAGMESMTTDKVSLGNPVNPKLNLFAQARDCLLPMGITSENVAHRFGITRQEQDQAAVESHKKAAAAVASGKFREEIIPVETKIVDPKTGEERKITVIADEGIRPDTSLEVLAKLKPAFTKDGTTTAGNASQVSDGAGAVLLMRRDVAMQKGLPVLGVFRSFAAVGVDPAVMGVGPAVAIPEAVKAAGLEVDDIDLFEINEAFASQYVYCCKKLGLDPAKVNVNGGAMAFGHPLGCTGARCVSTLLNEMKRRGKDCRFGVISMCIGSGMGAAAVFEQGDVVDELSNAKRLQSVNLLSKDAK